MIHPPHRPWFEFWFDSPYYHELYSNRDVEEARYFIDNIIETLSLKPGSSVLDLACGKGRHTAQLASHGYRATGIDLSEQNILAARENYPECRFIQADMRESFPGSYDALFNVFTSFGYFDDHRENIHVIRNMCQALKPEGWLVLDYLNPAFVAQNLVPEEEVVRENRTYRIHRFIEDDWIVKRIEFHALEREHQVEERVRLFTLESFLDLLAPHSMQMLHTFGNYSLDPYHSETSERMIMLIKK